MLYDKFGQKKDKNDIPALEDLIGVRDEAPAATESEKIVSAPASIPLSNTGREPDTADTPATISPAAKVPKAARQQAKKSEKKPADEDTMKEKYSIYLPEDLSLALRAESFYSRKKYSHIVESALTDMLCRRYQCNSCLTRFSISDTDNRPACCPVCGGKKIERLCSKH